ncbi:MULTISPECIES: DsbA family protein [unclassified Micromonospora]|uniref:DsbA family protein n=1 Tax=unclassified Micromonospora TaxID=2617518 RepID=UPI00331E81B8
MRIEVWADVVCAWAYIGKRRLERALASWEGATVEVVWRPYRIDPAAPAPGEPLADVLRDPTVDAALQRCAPDLTPGENRERVSRIAAAEGLGPPWGAGWRASSHNAHRLIALAHEAGGTRLQDAVAEEVMRAYFVDALDISLPAVLHKVARRAGFPEGSALLAGGGGDAVVRELVLRGRAAGVATSPTFVANGAALRGAQSPEVLHAFLSEAARRSPRQLPEEVERLRHAEALLDLGDPLGALTLLGPLLDAHGDDRGTRLLAARAYFHSAQLGRALAILEPLAAAAPDDSYVQLLLGRTLQRQGDARRAAVHLRLAAAMSPGYAA